MSSSDTFTSLSWIALVVDAVVLVDVTSSSEIDWKNSVSRSSMVTNVALVDQAQVPVSAVAVCVVDALVGDVVLSGVADLVDRVVAVGVGRAAAVVGRGHRAGVGELQARVPDVRGGDALEAGVLQRPLRVLVELRPGRRRRVSRVSRKSMMSEKASTASSFRCRWAAQGRPRPGWCRGGAGRIGSDRSVDRERVVAHVVDLGLAVDVGVVVGVQLVLAAPGPRSGRRSWSESKSWSALAVHVHLDVVQPPSPPSPPDASASPRRRRCRRPEAVAGVGVAEVDDLLALKADAPRRRRCPAVPAVGAPPTAMPPAPPSPPSPAWVLVSVSVLCSWLAAWVVRQVAELGVLVRVGCGLVLGVRPG